MSEQKTYLAVDLGASSGRVMAGHYDGEKLTLEEAHRFPNGPKEIDGSYRWDANELFAEVKEGLRKAGAKDGETIVSVGVDTWGVDYGLLDENDELIELPFAYRDGRTDGMEEEAARRVPRREIYEVTGIQFMFFNTLNQLLSEVVADRPELKKAKRLLFTPDLINFWLSGRAANEYTIASTSQMLDARSGTWADGLLEKLGLPRHLLGEVVQPGATLGSLRPDLAEELGVQPFDVVAVGSHDTASAVAAVPATDTKPYAYLSSGTWSLMGLESPQPIINDKSYEMPFTNEGGVCNTIRVLRNICGLWLVQECRRHWAEQGEEFSFAELQEMAEAAEPFVAVIDQDDLVFSTPGDMPQRIRTYADESGQRVPETKGEIVRCALESLALRYRWVFERLEELSGQQCEVLHLVGGGVKDTLLNQFAANALQRKVVAGPVEATATGNILVQMMASGDLADLQEGRKLVAKSFGTDTYEPADAEVWDQAYSRFLEVIS
jgi:rhamnulokinase